MNIEELIAEVEESNMGSEAKVETMELLRCKMSKGTKAGIKTLEKRGKEAEGEEMKEDKINGTAPLDYKDWTVIKEGIVENSQAANYNRGVKLEQNGGFFRISVCYPRGYTTEAEAVEKYEWLTEVR